MNKRGVTQKQKTDKEQSNSNRCNKGEGGTESGEEMKLKDENDSFMTSSSFASDN